MENKITVAELIKRLQELPQDNVISEYVINQIKEVINIDSIMNKKIHFTLDVTIPINELTDDKYELEEYMVSNDPLDGIVEWMSDGDDLYKTLFNNYKAELID